MVKEYGYEYDAVRDEALWKQTEGYVAVERLDGAACLRSGRDALKAVAREYEAAVVLMPALSCSSMVTPFFMNGHEVRYYRLNPDYTADIQSLELLIQTGRTNLFLYMDYFGLPSVYDDQLRALQSRHRRLVFIEDRTHTLIWEKKRSFQPDYVIGSLRKWVAVPDGGLLWGGTTKPFAEDFEFTVARLEAQCMRHTFLSTGDETIKTVYRKRFSEVSDILDARKEPYAMSAYTQAVVRETDWDKIRTVRLHNAEILTHILEAAGIQLLQRACDASALYVPFLVPNRGEVQRRLAELGVFTTVIWPLSEVQKNCCPVARFTEENLLAAPCDQRYCAADMVHVGETIARIVKDVNR